jgi:hypothetical protein
MTLLHLAFRAACSLVTSDEGSILIVGDYLPAQVAFCNTRLLGSLGRKNLSRTLLTTRHSREQNEEDTPQPELTTPLTSRTCLTPSTSSLQILSNGSITARHLHAFSNAWHDLAGHSRRVLETFVTLIKSSLITLALCSRLDLC